MPIAGIALTARPAWRVSLLPYRNWPPRKDEIPRMREIFHSGRSNTTLYRLERNRRKAYPLSTGAVANGSLR
jgi:hypothetical protein